MILNYYFYCCKPPSASRGWCYTSQSKLKNMASTSCVNSFASLQARSGDLQESHLIYRLQKSDPLEDGRYGIVLC